MTGTGSMGISLVPLDTLTVDIVTDDVSDNYVSKALFAVSEFANVVRAGAKALSGETLLCANLGFGCRLVSTAADVHHTLLFDTGPEGAIFHPQLRQSRYRAGRGRVHRGQPRPLGPYGCIAGDIGRDPRAGRKGGGPRQPRNVQRARGPIEQRNDLPGGCRALRRRDGGAGGDGRQQPSRAVVARRAFLFERRDPSGQRL